MARTTPTKIDPGRVESLARYGCPESEIAAFLGVPEDKLRRHRKAIARGRAARHIRLRQLQWRSAENGSVPMQTFLGKHELGQGDEKPAAVEKTIVRRKAKRG